MVLHERTQKILVSSCHYCVTGPRSTDRVWWGKCNCSIYLYALLEVMKNIKADTSKATILVISMGFLIIYLIFSWQWAIYVSLVVGLTGIISPALSRLIESGWMKLARVLSYIVPTILLGIVFYLLLFPISLISKLFTKDPLMLSNKHPSYFISVDREVNKKDLEKIW